MTGKLNMRTARTKFVCWTEVLRKYLSTHHRGANSIAIADAITPIHVTTQTHRAMGAFDTENPDNKPLRQPVKDLKTEKYKTIAITASTAPPAKRTSRPCQPLECFCSVNVPSNRIQRGNLNQALGDMVINKALTKIMATTATNMLKPKRVFNFHIHIL
jgi:hypothetical protein